MQLRDRIDKKGIPAHIAIIMDGNGRWAQKKSLSRSHGHAAGALVIEKLMDTALELNLKCVSLYAFSTENWSRPSTEIKGLWNLLERYFDEKIPILKAKGVRVCHSGVFDRLPSSVVRKIEDAVESTKHNKKITLNFCLNYGSRREIVDAVNEWSKTAKKGEFINEKKLASNLYTPGLPDVDLLIRTSGEMRISNFLLWQSAYAEFVFMKVLWPDFKPSHLYKAILEYQKRNRRFGGL